MRVVQAVPRDSSGGALWLVRLSLPSGTSARPAESCPEDTAWEPEGIPLDSLLGPPPRCGLPEVCAGPSKRTWKLVSHPPLSSFSRFLTCAICVVGHLSAARPSGLRMVSEASALRSRGWFT